MTPQMRIRPDERGYLRAVYRKPHYVRNVVLALLAGVFLLWLAHRPEPAPEQLSPDAAIGQYDRMLTDQGLAQPVHAVHDDAQCARFFTGELRSLLANSPCQSIRRAVFAATDRAGNPVIVSIAWVRFADAGAARAFADVYAQGRGWAAVWNAPHLHADALTEANASRSAGTQGTVAVLAAANAQLADLAATTADQVTALPPL